MKIIVAYRGIPHKPGWAAGDSLVRAFRRLGHDVYEYGNYYKTNKLLNKSPVPERADLLVYVECNDSDPQYLELKDFPAKNRFYWDFDVGNKPGNNLAFARRMGFDHVFVANRNFVEHFSSVAPQVTFLAYAIDDELLVRRPEVPKTIEVGLVGSPYSGRIALIEMMREAGINARIVNGVYGDAMVEAINSFQINLNHNVLRGRGLLTGRVWEATGCGTLLLNEREDYIEEFFEDGKHVVLYDSPEDCLRKVKHLLVNPDELHAIADAGYRWGREHHTYIHRAQTMLDSLNSQASLDREPVPLSIRAEVERLIFVRRAKDMAKRLIGRT